VSIIVFTLIHMVPGDPTQVMIGIDQRITPEQREVIRRSVRTRPAVAGPIRKNGSAMSPAANLGRSIAPDETVADELKLRLPVTIEPYTARRSDRDHSAISVGVVAAVKRNSGSTMARRSARSSASSVPNFLLATLLVLLLSYQLKWLPPIGYRSPREDVVQNLKTMIMPAISLALPFAAVMMRNTRSAVLEAMGQDHVRVARAKGLGSARVLVRHVLKNASIPIITVGGIQIATLLGGTVIIETIFSLPGIGRYIYEAIENRDYPVVQGVTLVVSTIFVLVTVLVDVLYAVLDPRIRER
jgi:peptide/nickel transport system permease protein